MLFKSTKIIIHIIRGSKLKKIMLIIYNIFCCSINFNIIKFPSKIFLR